MNSRICNCAECRAKRNGFAGEAEMARLRGQFVRPAPSPAPRRASHAAGRPLQTSGRWARRGRVIVLYDA